MARLRWALSANGLIGLLAVVPAFAITTGTVHADSDAAPIFCILWVLKLGVHAPAMDTLARVISNERATLASVLIIFIIVLCRRRDRDAYVRTRTASPSSSAAFPPRCGGRW